MPDDPVGCDNSRQVDLRPVRSSTASATSSESLGMTTMSSGLDMATSSAVLVTVLMAVRFQLLCISLRFTARRVFPISC